MDVGCDPLSFGSWMPRSLPGGGSIKVGCFVPLFFCFFLFFAWLECLISMPEAPTLLGVFSSVVSMLHLRA
jgi:hypothetical protein